MAEQSVAPPEVRLILSRPCYPLGGTVVGTVLIPAGLKRNESVHVHVAGYGRIDGRWHNIERYGKLYRAAGDGYAQTHPLLLDDSKYLGEASYDPYESEPTVVCHWATNVLNLNDIPSSHDEDDRTWEKQKPRALLISNHPTASSSTAAARAIHIENDLEVPELDHCNDDDEMEQGEDIGSNDERKPAKIQLYNEDGLAFTFRVDIPWDVPPTANLACCRYFYTAVVTAKDASGKRFVVQAPFTLLSTARAPPIQNQQLGRTSVKMGTCTAMAHPRGLPCHVPVTALHEPAQISARRRFRHGDTAVQTLRVTSNDNGRPCCLLSMVGLSTLYPGGQVLLQFDFTPALVLGNENDNNNAEEQQKMLPCFQVCACLEGEELAIQRASGGMEVGEGATRRTRYNVFDSAHERVEPGYTDTISMTFILPLDAPCTLQTDIVQVLVRCKVDLTVGRMENDKVVGYDTLQLEVPCQVVHQEPQENDIETADDEDDPDDLLSELFESDAGTEPKFATRDIRTDLLMLSKHMIRSH
eukprot:scaffold8102_cov53-Attheya_sp.AAC.1